MRSGCSPAKGAYFTLCNLIPIALHVTKHLHDLRAIFVSKTSRTINVMTPTFLHGRKKTLQKTTDLILDLIYRPFTIPLSPWFFLARTVSIMMTRTMVMIHKRQNETHLRAVLVFLQGDISFLLHNQQSLTFLEPPLALARSKRRSEVGTFSISLWRKQSSSTALLANVGQVQRPIVLHPQLGYLGATPQRTLGWNITDSGSQKSPYAEVRYGDHTQGNSKVGRYTCLVLLEKLCCKNGMI